ncbi:hypothetical protein [Simkania negevensis]|uniref:hypothetical protein n=1 Tax=Simkania negevensis TaxID=83561 RepID=UPI0011D18768|nr:hypothetical protein [Simkania negevensis]
MAGNAQTTMNMESDLVKDVSLVLLGWVLGLFTLPLSKDGEAREKCLNKLNELKRALEDLPKHMKNRTSEQQCYDHLKQAKTLFEDLNICQTGLLFRPPNLTHLLTESLALMRKMDPSNENRAFHITQTAVQITMLWNNNKHISQEFPLLEEIQQSISKHFLGRIVDSCRFCIKPKNK